LFEIYTTMAVGAYVQMSFAPGDGAAFFCAKAVCGARWMQWKRRQRGQLALGWH
jgi:hypothetical protein